MHHGLTRRTPWTVHIRKPNAPITACVIAKQANASVSKDLVGKRAKKVQNIVLYYFGFAY